MKGNYENGYGMDTAGQDKIIGKINYGYGCRGKHIG